MSCRYDLFDRGDGHIRVRFEGRMDAANAAFMVREIKDVLQARMPRSLTIDLQNVTYLDDFGALVLLEAKKMISDDVGHFSLENVGRDAQRILSVLNFDALGKKQVFSQKQRPNVFVRLGEGVLEHASDLKHMVSFVGSVCLSLLHVAVHPRSLRKDDLVLCMQRTGVDALPIVGLISFLLGLIMAFMSSVQLRQFGADIYVASLVSLAMTRELGPIMTAIIVAGRSGSAFAAEIATMKISEEVDALFTMGFDPTRFLVVPKVIAAVIVVPLLTLFSDVFAILGGLVVGMLTLDLTANAYMAQTIKTLTLFDVFLGVFKSAVFALLVSWVGCLRGFQVRGGAASVGRATTSAVVSGIFLIILFNSVFSVILRYWE
ncbi:MAG: MlaE family lipid ABC transporter permease subunit [Deltaproteobacteria bacterium]|nr:MlaE family lipid ABC transporter permease subunit [Deltaproteobacteria bacterium]